MDKNINESFQKRNKNIIIIKFILLLILIFLNVKLRNFKKKNPKEDPLKSIPRLRYYYIDMNPYKEIINLENEGKLEIYTNTDTSKEIQTKNSEKIIKSQIVFIYD